MEYGESEGGISDEEEDSSVPITSSVTGTAVLPESHNPQTPTAVLPTPSPMPAKRTLALNYYFGLDQAEDGRSSHPQTDAATAVASIGASGVPEDSSSSSDSSESLFDGLSRSSSNSSNTSSSSSSSSTSSYLRDPQLEISTSVGIAAAQQHLEEPTECIRRSASEGAELASLDRSEGASSSTQKQQERPSTANAPGRLLLPSVVSISAFRLGPIGFRRVTSAADAAPGMQQPTAPAAACASASEGSTEAPGAVVDAVGLDGSAVVEGHLQTAMRPKMQLPLDGFSLSPPATRGSSVAVAAESGHVLQPLGPGFRAAALLGLQVKEAEAGAATQTATRTSEAPGASTGEFTAAGRVEQHLSMGDTNAAAGDSCGDSCTAVASASSNLGVSIAPSENRRSKSEDAAPAYSSLRIGADASVVLEGVQPKGCRASAQTGAVSHADSSSRRSVAPAHFTSARFEPPPVSAAAPTSSATRLWLPRSTREMHACSSTSAMFMALAQETPERTRSPEGSKVGMPRNSFSAAFAAAGAATKAGEAAAREAAAIRASTAGTADGLGSYSSFESTDPLTSRCDSFASAASRTRNDDEAHVAGLQQMQQKKGDGTAGDCQHTGSRSADTSAVPRTASYESLLTGSSKEAGEASPPSSRSSVS